MLTRRVLAGILVLLPLSAAAQDAGKDKPAQDKASEGKPAQGTPSSDKPAPDKAAPKKSDDDDDDDDDDDEAPQAKSAKRYPQPVKVGDLIGRKVLQPKESQPVLGLVQEIVHAPDGKADMIMSFGGWFGFGARQISVPMDAVVLLGEHVAVADFTPSQLSSFPTVSRKPDAYGANEMIRVGLSRPFH